MIVFIINKSNLFDISINLPSNYLNISKVYLISKFKDLEHKLLTVSLINLSFLKNYILSYYTYIIYLYINKN